MRSVHPTRTPDALSPASVANLITRRQPTANRTQWIIRHATEQDRFCRERMTFKSQFRCMYVPPCSYYSPNKTGYVDTRRVTFNSIFLFLRMFSIFRDFSNAWPIQTNNNCCNSFGDDWWGPRCGLRLPDGKSALPQCRKLETETTTAGWLLRSKMILGLTVMSSTGSWFAANREPQLRTVKPEITIYIVYTAHVRTADDLPFLPVIFSRHRSYPCNSTQ